MNLSQQRWINFHYPSINYCKKYLGMFSRCKYPYHIILLIACLKSFVIFYKGFIKQCRELQESGIRTHNYNNNEMKVMGKINFMPRDIFPLIVIVMKNSAIQLLQQTTTFLRDCLSLHITWVVNVSLSFSLSQLSTMLT